MPSGKAHDVITLALVPPTAAGTYLLLRDPLLAAIVTIAFVFAGLMFGPDLDTNSRPYRRWGPARLLWYPYRRVVKHRSRFSHGLVFGTLVRTAYFLAVAGLLFGAFLVARDVYFYNLPASPHEFVDGVRRLWFAVATIEPRYLGAGFFGLWWGAASHTLSDVLGSTLRSIWHSL